jgi:hypothetical protein
MLSGGSSSKSALPALLREYSNRFLPPVFPNSPLLNPIYLPQSPKLEPAQHLQWQPRAKLSGVVDQSGLVLTAPVKHEANPYSRRAAP